MNWNTVKLIWLREVRDQLRDRRTLFMIAVLPVLLYPLLGMSFLQVAQFLQEHPTKVLLVGVQPIPNFPPLIEEKPATAEEKDQPANVPRVAQPVAKGKGGQDQNSHRERKYRFNGQWAGDGLKRDLLDLDVQSPDDLHLSDDPAKSAGEIRRRIHDADYDVVVYFPADFSSRLEQFRQELVHRAESSVKRAAPALDVPSPELYYNSAKEKSQIAFARVSQVIGKWQTAVGAQTLRDSNVPETAARPFNVTSTDVADSTQRQAAVWSKILPFVLLIWALTGAFYPAIDLCAGEKERGTLETLLCSPAERSEIVTGKLLAVMLFSMATSLLNMASLGVTGLLVMRQAVGLGAAGIPAGLPPLGTLVWLILALVPVSALFSALCLALAVFARSSKEGQYYLMPLVLITMPLLVLPMAPGVELTLGNSLIPLSGLILLLRMLLEGNLREALPFVPPVVLVTLVCCRVAMRWAADQFNKENVLFRESERWDMRLWLKHLWRDRGETPTLGAAVFCGVLILIVQFFIGLLLASNQKLDFAGAVGLALVSQLVPIAAPVALLTWFLTRSPRKTLLLRRPAPAAILAALAMAVAVHPVASALQMLLEELYPAGRTAEALGEILKLFQQAPAWWIPLLVIAILPAFCEEFAFRGFILSGLRHSGSKWRAIVISSLFFGISHQVLQQSLVAFAVGMLIGYIAVQSGSIWPGLVFHATYNSLGWLQFVWNKEIDRILQEQPALAWSLLFVGAVIVLWLANWFGKLDYQPTKEEQLQESIEKEAAGALHM
ncbi:MAG TPA: ABC transporter permease subunit/CPBP intramembrane protease [Pirellulales bacterium]|jgi:sodium transport system permease protein|nr:ABC transporter permease subunit/CPBP intramembrane protease [Pirellulales bacterium]